MEAYEFVAELQSMLAEAEQTSERLARELMEARAEIGKLQATINRVHDMAVEELGFCPHYCTAPIVDLLDE